MNRATDIANCANQGHRRHAQTDGRTTMAIVDDGFMVWHYSSAASRLAGAVPGWGGGLASPDKQAISGTACGNAAQRVVPRHTSMRSIPI
jgi:hypothetical protein